MLRFIRYTFTGIQPRHRHQASFIKKHGVTLLAAFAGASVLSMPIWMIALGII